MIREFCAWLAATPASEFVADHFWVIPAVQTVHILAIAVVMSSMAMLDLRLLRLAGRQSLADTAQRLLPWIWWAVLVLLCSGILLIVGEPGRELQSPVFWIKMSLLAGALLLTGLIQAVLRSGSGFWERHGAAAGVTAVASLLLWTGIVTAGRWIAYVEHG